MTLILGGGVLRIGSAAMRLAAAGGGAAPRLSGLNITASGVSITANRAGTLRVMVDSAFASYPTWAAFNAASGSADTVQSFSVTAGTNNLSIDTTSFSTGRRRIHFDLEANSQHSTDTVAVSQEIEWITAPGQFETTGFDLIDQGGDVYNLVLHRSPYDGGAHIDNLKYSLDGGPLVTIPHDGSSVYAISATSGAIYSTQVLASNIEGDGPLSAAKDSI